MSSNLQGSCSECGQKFAAKEKRRFLYLTGQKAMHIVAFHENCLSKAFNIGTNSSRQPSLTDDYDCAWCKETVSPNARRALIPANTEDHRIECFHLSCFLRMLNMTSVFGKQCCLRTRQTDRYKKCSSEDVAIPRIALER